MSLILNDFIKGQSVLSWLERHCTAGWSPEEMPKWETFKSRCDGYPVVLATLREGDDTGYVAAIAFCEKEFDYLVDPEHRKKTPHPLTFRIYGVPQSALEGVIPAFKTVVEHLSRNPDMDYIVLNSDTMSSTMKKFLDESVRVTDATDTIRRIHGKLYTSLVLATVKTMLAKKVLDSTPGIGQKTKESIFDVMAEFTALAIKALQHSGSKVSVEQLVTDAKTLHNALHRALSEAGVELKSGDEPQQPKEH